jgi:hypothetical protein
VTLEELQALAMKHATQKLERFRAELVRAELAAESKDRKPDGFEWYHEQVAEQELQIAKLTYLHERERAELEAAERSRTLAYQLDLARLAELEHLAKHREEILREFMASTAANREGLTAIAKAIKPQ